jgi:hypothetical protein
MKQTQQTKQTPDDQKLDVQRPQLLRNNNDIQEIHLLVVSHRQ